MLGRRRYGCALSKGPNLRLMTPWPEIWAVGLPAYTRLRLSPILAVLEVPAAGPCQCNFARWICGTNRFAGFLPERVMPAAGNLLGDPSGVSYQDFRGSSAEERGTWSRRRGAELTPRPRTRNNGPTLPSASTSLRVAVILLVCTIALSLMAGCGGASEGGDHHLWEWPRKQRSECGTAAISRAQRIHERKEDAEAEVQDAEEEGE